MTYTKIYYDDIWEATSKGSVKCKEWLSELQVLSESFNAFIESGSFKGQAAASMKDYLNEIHGMLIAIIGSVVQSYSVLATDYYGGYTRTVDTGNGDKYGLRYTTIVNSEVSDTGTIQNKLSGIVRMAEQVANDANSVKSSISDLASIASSPRTDALFAAIINAKAKAQTVHSKAIAYEASRQSDFNEIDRLIAQALRIIDAQSGNIRIPVIAYQQGSIGTMCDINQVLVDLQATSDKIKSITENEYFEEDVVLALNRDALIQEEEEASREWIQWVAVGVAAVGAIALIAVTAGGATPLVCAAVGAGTGALTAATGKFADNYVKTGSLVEGMDWSDFGKDVLVATVGGAVTGYLGAVSQGSAIKQPIQKGMYALSNTLVKEGAEGVTATIWETGETIYEVGEAIIAGKPGDEILSVLGAGLEEMEGELSDTIKDMAVEGTKSFVGGTVAGQFDIDTSDKSILRKIGEKTVEGVAGDLAGGSVKTVWYVGEAVLDSDSSTTVESALKMGLKETAQDVSGSVVEATVSGVGDYAADKVNGTVGKIIGKTASDTLSGTTGEVAKGVTGRGMDYIYGDEKDANKIFGDIWEEDLDGGRKIAKEAAESFGKHVSNEVYEDKKLSNELKKIDRDGDGKIEVVQFDEYAVTKQDYDAAVKNAGKGAYKDKTVQDILGLAKDTDISSGKERTVRIDMVEKYSSGRKTTDTVTVDGKYTFRKSYYESALNAAGRDEYRGKTAQEILGIPDDVDLSEDKLTYKRVDNDKIGAGWDKEVKLHEDYGTNATKLHISSMTQETRLKREEEEKQKQKQEQAQNKNK